MKRLNLFIIAGVIVFGGFVAVSPVGAQTDNHTAREEAEGEIVWQKLQSKEVVCGDLSDEDFGALGEYYMGQMLGDSHEAMNEMMTRMHGEDGEEQIHIIMGKRLSGCDTSATVPGISGGWMPMMNMLAPYQSGAFGSGMWSFGSFGWIFMILWWVLIIAGIVALIKWLAGQSRGSREGEKSALEILKERYAKGEIDKKEFEEKKKDLS
ncbi:MAG: SHOCT domain-containing protein [bacterium]|nr:SHOCT domain-containing protein [bacterium]